MLLRARDCRAHGAGENGGGVLEVDGPGGERMGEPLGKPLREPDRANGPAVDPWLLRWNGQRRRFHFSRFAADETLFNKGGFESGEFESGLA